MLEVTIGTRLRGAARRHEEVMMMAVDERREAAAHILAEGVVRLLATGHDDITVTPVLEEGGPCHPKSRVTREHLRLVTEGNDSGRGQ